MKREYAIYVESMSTEKEVLKKSMLQLKQQRPKELDANFHALHAKAFKEIDCLSCANCCKTTSPIFRDVDIKRISKQLRMKESAFVRAFLGDDNKCSIYDFRPLACREYPHTDRKNMHQILDLTLKNTAICPAVAKIIQTLVSPK